MRTALAALALIAYPASAQEAGWHYSPVTGEGDRAAMGCGQGSDATAFTCLVVRCEDDYAVGLHLHTSRAGGDAGRWRVDIDEDSYPVAAATSDAPYGARVVEGDVAAMFDALKNGAVAYLDPLEGEPVTRNGISLSGSLYAINQALYFCAAPVAPAPEATATTPP